MVLFFGWCPVPCRGVKPGRGALAVEPTPTGRHGGFYLQMAILTFGIATKGIPITKGERQFRTHHICPLAKGT